MLVDWQFLFELRGQIRQVDVEAEVLSWQFDEAGKQAAMLLGVRVDQRWIDQGQEAALVSDKGRVPLVVDLDRRAGIDLFASQKAL